MQPRIAYSARKDGRHFTVKKLEQLRKDKCELLRKVGKIALAESYEKMTLVQFGAYNGYVVVKH